jgi:hypothetical protein
VDHDVDEDVLLDSLDAYEVMQKLKKRNELGYFEDAIQHVWVGITHSIGCHVPIRGISVDFVEDESAER